MSEVYWAGMIELDDSSAKYQLDETDSRAQAAQAMSELLEKTRIHTVWVDLVYWQSRYTGGAFLPKVMEKVGFPRERPAGFSYPAAPGLDHLLLNAAGRALMARDTEVILIGQQQDNYCIAAVMISPAAVGRRNLMPVARMALRSDMNALRSEPETLLAGIGGLLELAGYDASYIGWLAVTPGLAQMQQHLKSVFPAALWLPLVPGRPRGVLFRMGELVRALDESQRSYGLLISQEEEQPVQITFVERM
jgi:hypothetical protein